MSDKEGERESGNRYEAPQARLDEAAVSSVSEQAIARGYKPLRPWANALAGAFTLVCLWELTLVFWGLGRLMLPAEFMTADSAEAFRTIFNSGISAMNVLRLGIMGAFFVFIARANRNAPVFWPWPLAFSPGFAAVSFVVPIGNLWLPFQAMREIWQTSDPSRPPEQGSSGSAWVVAAWWLTFVGGNVFVILRRFFSDFEPGRIVVDTLNHCVVFTSAAFAIHLVLSLSHRQEACCRTRRVVSFYG